MALLLIGLGLVKLTLSLWGMAYPPIRQVEDELPDVVQADSDRSESIGSEQTAAAI
jgi:hypothetical protein